MIMAFSDGETEARKMISLGTKLTLEVRSVASEQGLQWMGGDGDASMCVERERALAFVWVLKNRQELELQS